jgi:hypothetical protein
MSKPRFRILIAVLLSLVLLVGVFSVVQGAALRSGARSGQYFVDAGLMPDMSRQRSAEQAGQALAPYYETGKGGGCERDQHSSPDD